MRIVKRPEFLTLPEGTLYAKYSPCIFGDLLIKGETLPTNDWCYQGIVDAIKCRDSGDFSERLEIAETMGSSLPMDFDCGSRDGCFEPDDTLFAVFECADLAQLVVKLYQCLP